MLLKEIQQVVRKLIKEVNYSIINLIGLTLGVSVAYLVFAHIVHENSYDKHLPHAGSIYRVVADFKINGHSDVYSNAPRPMGKTLVEEFPDVLYSTKLLGYGGLQNHRGYLIDGETRIYSDKLFAADSGFFKVFNLPLLAGTYDALDGPNRIVLSETLAKKLFGNEDPMGKQVQLENQKMVTVTGILKDMMQPTYMKYEGIISYQTFYNTMDSEQWWYGGHVYSFVRTTPSFKPAQIYDQWTSFFNKYMKPTFDELNGTATIRFQPLTSLYLSPELIWEPFPHGSKQANVIFLIVGLFLIMVAAFNFMNLSVSQALSRTKEVRVRRILGSTGWGLIRHKLLESTLIAILVSILSISLISTLLPLFEYLTEDPTQLSFIRTPKSIGSVFLLSVITALMASVYPALFSSRISFSENKNIKMGYLSIRKGFVTLQQVISIALVIGMLVVVDQIRYIQARDIGFNPNELLILRLNDTNIREAVDPFVAGLKQLPGVHAVSRIDETPMTGVDEFTLSMQQADGTMVSTPSQTIGAGLTVVDAMQLDLVAGRTFKKSDHEYQGVIINEFMAKKLGYSSPEAAVGASVRFSEEEPDTRRVIGVVKDFYMGSPREELKSMVIGLFVDGKRYLIVRLNKEKRQQTIQQIEQLWNQHGAYLPFSYSFMRDELNFLMKKDQQLFDLLILGSVVIMLISCLGIFGIASHMVVQKTKEIGIRKVIGASKIHLYLSTSKDFFISYFVAVFLGGITAWIGIQQWLNEFAYRVTFNPSNVLIGAFIGLVLLVLTLSYHMRKVVLSNPVESLRDE